jgi:Gas vesicle synthesis protein GvpO
MATKKTPSSSADDQAPAKKQPPRKTAKKVPAKKGASPRSGNDAPRTEAPRRKSGTRIAAEAAQQLLEVTGRQVEGITALERTDHGWRVQVEVLEVSRIPNTTDVLALYDLDVGSDGELDGYRRVERYIRGTPGEGGRS